MSDITPINPIELFIRMMVVAFGIMFLMPVSQGSMGSTSPPSPAGSSTAMTRVPHVIENVEPLIMESYPMQVTLEVSGYQPDGCEYPVQVAQRQEGTTVYVEIFREVPPNVRCAQAAIPYQERIALVGGFVNEDYTVYVNDFVLTLALGQQAQTVSVWRVDHVIEHVEIGRYPSFAPYPAPLFARVTGYQPDGCEYPVQVMQRQEGTTLYVEIFREIPADIACPMIIKSYEAEIPLEGTFNEGTYTFIINGMTITRPI